MPPSELCLRAVESNYFPAQIAPVIGFVNILTHTFLVAVSACGLKRFNTRPLIVLRLFNDCTRERRVEITVGRTLWRALGVVDVPVIRPRFCWFS
jgi:hypothetical protein